MGVRNADRANGGHSQPCVRSRHVRQSAWVTRSAQELAGPGIWHWRVFAIHQAFDVGDVRRSGRPFAPGGGAGDEIQRTCGEKLEFRSILRAQRQCKARSSEPTCAADQSTAIPITNSRDEIAPWGLAITAVRLRGPVWVAILIRTRFHRARVKLGSRRRTQGTSASPRKATQLSSRSQGPRSARGRNRYRDSPLRGGASLTALRLGRASIAGRAEPSITVAAARSSSTVQHELRCFSRSQRSPAFTCREVMRIVVLQETPVPRRASRRRRSVHISHSRFAGLQRRSHSAHNFLVKWTCCHFAQVIEVTSDPRITFPYLLKIRTSTLGLCALSTGSRPAMASLA